jgi:cytochrome c553
MNGHRSAGALNGTLTGHVADATTGYDVGTGHTLGVTGTAPGGTFTNPAGFSCADCHAVHGNAAYRNLGDISKGFTAAMQPTYSSTTVGVNVWDYDVVEEQPASYDTVQVQFGFGAGANRMNAYCARCHGNFHSSANVAGTGSNFRRHPTGSAVATERYDFATTSGVRGTGAFQASDIVRAVRTSATNVSPGCLTCHKGHGNQRAFGLVHPGETAGVVNATNANTENGDLAGVVDYTGTRTFYNPKTLCQSCHVQGQ